MRQIHDMKLCCFCGFWGHLDTELLNASLIHRVGTENGSAVDRKPGAYR